VTDNGTRNEPGTRFDVHLAEAGADRIVASSDGYLRPVAWSGDGHRLLLARGDGHVALLDVPTGAVTRVPGTYRDVADLSSDGTSILAVDSARRVVAVSAWGRQRILARRGRFPSWSR
jgi:WD40 repeat protein